MNCGGSSKLNYLITSEKLKEILQKGESAEVEFKTSQFELSKNAFESICAFLNRRGGHLLLGIKDTGEVEGVAEDCIESIINNIITNLIEKDMVYAENWNRPHGSIGVIDPTNFSPYPKNPVIAKFFKEIGRVDELGSGIRNTFKYCGIYTPGTEPEFIEGDIFKTIIPLEAKEAKVNAADATWENVRSQLGDRLGDRSGGNEWKILKIIWETPASSIPEIARKVGISSTAIENNLKKLRNKGLIGRVGSPRTRYWKINI